MTILDIFNNVNKEELASRIIELHSYYFAKENSFKKNKEQTLLILDEFYKDIENIIPYSKKDKEFQEYKDFIVLIDIYYDDSEYEGKDIFELSHTNFDLNCIEETKLVKSFYVDGIHISQLKKNYKILDYSWEEILKMKDYMKIGIISYGLDFLTRKIVLNLTVAQPCIDRYGLIDVASELFWELTFYGLTENKIQSESDELLNRLDSVKNGSSELKDLDELVKEMNNNEDLEIEQSEINFSMDFSKKINIYNHFLKNKYYKEVYDWVIKEKL